MKQQSYTSGSVSTYLVARVDHVAMVRVESRVHQAVVPLVADGRHAVGVHLGPVRVRGGAGEAGQAGGGRGRRRRGRRCLPAEVVLAADASVPAAVTDLAGVGAGHAALVHPDGRPLVRAVRVFLHVLRQVRLLKYELRHVVVHLIFCALNIVFTCV